MNARPKLNTCKSNVIETWRTGAEEISICLVVLHKDFMNTGRVLREIIKPQDLSQQDELVEY